MSTKRPYTTLYFSTHKDVEAETYSRMGRAGSEVGALRAAVVRVFMGEYSAATVYLDYVPLLTITKVRNGISVGYGRVSSKTRAVMAEAHASAAQVH